ncbi:MAG: hypothetical protein Hyperionvirus13_40 [Hyperionvirus sp.]|uniref:Uncharacterized protein n=1 Tax=Hyperionvirus sp. TaxID=2487770 RepID=A0A3G5A9F7_9VIRU|nr:MAG: hypothetical protein Hyperionvirus13_40 [Hyperionvirus sp.]
MCDRRQCCAPHVEEKDKRCPNETNMRSSHHCDDHFGKAIQLYKKYKLLSDKVYNMDPEREFRDRGKKIQYLNRCIDLYRKAYEARMIHRNFAFVPECFDYGHNLQFKIIQGKIDVCEEKLEEIYREDVMGDEIVDAISGEEEDGEEVEIHKIIGKVRKFKRERMRDELETERLLAVYIEENRVSGIAKKRVANLYVSLIRGVLLVAKEEYEKGGGPGIINVDDVVLQIMVSHLIYKLCQMNYLSGEYKPTKCKECNCNSFATEPMKFGCDCYVEEFDDARDNLMLMEHCWLKRMLEKGLKYRKKVEPLVKDIFFTYVIYERDMLEMEMFLGWDAKEGRLVLEETSYHNEKKKKMSRFMASFRLRKKLYEKVAREHNMEISSDEGDDDIKVREGELSALV